MATVSDMRNAYADIGTSRWSGRAGVLRSRQYGQPQRMRTLA
jgi:hypothetical protein